MKSKEGNLLELFFNEPTKQWRFKELRTVGLPDNKISQWLKKFITEELIQKITPKGKLPFYISNYNHANYQNRKRLFMQQKLYESGFLNHLTEGIKCANHQCLFAYLCTNHPKLELDWNFFEHLRTKRNGIHYYGETIAKTEYKASELQLNLYIKTLRDTLKITTK